MWSLVQDNFKAFENWGKIHGGNLLNVMRENPLKTILLSSLVYCMMRKNGPRCDISSKDRVIVIVGGSGGIGSLAAKELISSKWNAKVIVIDYSLEQMEKVFEKCENLKLIECDITNNEQVEKTAKLIQEQLLEWNVQHVFSLINSAGITSSPKTEKTSGLVELSETEMLDVFGVNILGPIRMIRSIFPMMAQNQQDPKSNGIIINVASAASYSAVKFTGFYSTTKFALYGFSDGLRREFKSINGLRVTCIEPGFAKTQILNMKPFNEQSLFFKPYSELYQVAKKMMDNAQSPQTVSKVICEQIFSTNNEKHILIDHWYMRLLNKFLFYTGIDL